ncbi:MAG: TolC family protein [Candidatus Saccharicenans sp.]|nr:TolC family protein [Candidatus Saccharicenans sp.]
MRVQWMKTDNRIGPYRASGRSSEVGCVRLFMFIGLTLFFSISVVVPGDLALTAGNNSQSDLVSSEKVLGLEECLEIALSSNPLILAGVDQYQAARARINIARSWPQPEFLLDYPLQPSIFAPRRSEEKFFWLYQTVEFPGRRFLRTRMASLEASENYQDLESLKLSIAYQVKEAFFNLLLAEEQLKYAQDNLQLNREFTEMVEAKHSAGEVSRAEVLRAQVELSRAESLVKRYELERDILAARLNLLLGRDKNEPIAVTGNLRQPLLEMSLEQVREEALKSRPEIKKAEYSLAKMMNLKRQSYLGYLPDFNLGLARHQVEGIRYWDFSLSFSLPLFFWQKKRGEIAEAEALISAGQKEIKYWQNLVYLEVEEAYRQVIFSEKQVKLFEENILDKSEEVYQLLLFSYKEGQIGGLDLIEARRTWLESRITHAEYLCQHTISLAALAKAIGRVE